MHAQSKLKGPIKLMVPFSLQNMPLSALTIISFSMWYQLAKTSKLPQ